MFIIVHNYSLWHLDFVNGIAWFLNRCWISFSIVFQNLPCIGKTHSRISIAAITMCPAYAQVATAELAQVRCVSITTWHWLVDALLLTMQCWILRSTWNAPTQTLPGYDSDLFGHAEVPSAQWCFVKESSGVFKCGEMVSKTESRWSQSNLRFGSVWVPQPPRGLGVIVSSFPCLWWIRCIVSKWLCLHGLILEVRCSVGLAAVLIKHALWQKCWVPSSTWYRYSVRWACRSSCVPKSQTCSS